MKLGGFLGVRSVLAAAGGIDGMLAAKNR